jgi:hypothetical protein
MEIAGTSFCCPGFLESCTHIPSRRTRASRGGSVIGLDKKNRTIAELTGIRIAPRIKAVNPSRFKRIPGCFDKPLAPVRWRWVKNRPAGLLGFGLLSSVVNGCQRTGGFEREDWNHKAKSLRGQKAGKAESQKAGKPGNTESQRTQRGEAESREAESREAESRGNTESQRTQREKSRWWGQAWELANPAKTCNGRFGMLPYEGGCKRRKRQESFGNVGFSTSNPCACPFARRPLAIRSQSVHCHRTLCPKSPANHLPVLYPKSNWIFMLKP